MEDIKEDIRHKKIVDAKEPEIIRSKLLGLGWYQQALYTGDYSFFSIDYKKIGIERKSIPDFASSLGERLSEQLYRMTEHYDISILLLEGSWQIVRDNVMVVKGVESWGWSMVWNYLLSCQLQKGIALYFTANEGHTIKAVNELYAYFQKAVHTTGINRSIVGDPRLLAFQCGGIGPKIGKALLSKFGSIKAVANADMEEYLDIEKMGKVRAQRLHDHMCKSNKKVTEVEEVGVE